MLGVESAPGPSSRTITITSSDSEEENFSFDLQRAFPSESPPREEAPTPPPKPPVRYTKKGKFRLDANRFFITYPRCDTDPKDVQRRVMKHFLTKIEWALIAKEKHRDGTPHLHVALKLKDRITVRNPRSFDKLAGSHGNVQFMRDEEATVRYLRKEDPSPIAIGSPPSGDPGSKAAPKRKITDEIAEAVLEGATLSELVQTRSHLGFLMMNQTKIQSFSNLARTMKTSVQTSRPTKICIDWKADGYEPAQAFLGPEFTTALIQLAGWVNRFLLKGQKSHQTQLWLVGTPGIGKTTFLELISERVTTHWQAQEGWFDGLCDATELIIFDEFDGRHITRATFCQALDGIVNTRLKVRNGQFVFTRPLPVIVSSNYLPKEIWTESIDLHAVSRRILIVDFKTLVEKKVKKDGGIFLDLKIGPPLVYWASEKTPALDSDGEEESNCNNPQDPKSI